MIVEIWSKKFIQKEIYKITKNSDKILW